MKPDLHLHEVGQRHAPRVLLEVENPTSISDGSKMRGDVATVDTFNGQQQPRERRAAAIPEAIEEHQALPRDIRGIRVRVDDAATGTLREGKCLQGSGTYRRRC